MLKFTSVRYFYIYKNNKKCLGYKVFRTAKIQADIFTPLLTVQIKKRKQCIQHYVC